MIGKRFGRLTILEYVRYSELHRPPRGMYLCQCDCGNKKYIRTDSVKSGITTSCGCYRLERTSTHKLTGTKLYKAWDAMKQRCYNPTCDAYKDYGARGITICDEWRYNLKAFYDWSMANGYADHLTINRIDNDGNYEPDNCEWTTFEKQNRNRRSTKLTMEAADKIRDDPRPYKLIAEEYGVYQSTISRIKNGKRWNNTDKNENV